MIAIIPRASLMRTVYSCGSFSDGDISRLAFETLECRDRQIEQLERTLAGTAQSYNEAVRELAARPTTWAYGQACKALRQAHDDQDLIIKQILPRIPENERWLWQNRRALLSVLHGGVQAAAGELTDGPDLEAGAKLIEDMESRPISVSQARRLTVQTGLSIQECQRRFVRDQTGKISKR